MSKNPADNKKNLEAELFEAIYVRDLDSVKRLIEQEGVDINCQDEMGRTAYALACLRPYLISAQYLLNKTIKEYLLSIKNINMNLEDIYGNTMKDYGSEINEYQYNYNIYSLLKKLRYGARLPKEGSLHDLKKQHTRKKLLSATVRGDLTEVRKLFSDYDDYILKHSYATAKVIIFENELDTIAQELFNGNNQLFDHTYTGGVTLLHVAAFCGHEELGKWLLERKLDPDATDNDGHTPLMFASFRKNEFLVNLLANIYKSYQFTSTGDIRYSAYDLAHIAKDSTTLDLMLEGQYGYKIKRMDAKQKKLYDELQREPSFTAEEKSMIMDLLENGVTGSLVRKVRKELEDERSGSEFSASSASAGVARSHDDGDNGKRPRPASHVDRPEASASVGSLQQGPDRK